MSFTSYGSGEQAPDQKTFVSPGFRGRRQDQTTARRIPPGQYVVRDFPVLSAGPTPHTPVARWTFSITGEVEAEKRWTWDEFRKLPSERITRDIHCVTKWSKLDTVWEGVSVDTLLQGVETSAEFVTAFSDGDYTTNLPLEDITGGKAWVAFNFGGEPLAPEHGGPARLLVPHLYFWKSAKWVRGLRLMPDNEPGFWEGTAITCMVTRGGSSGTAATDTLPVDIAAHAPLRVIGRHAGTTADQLVVTRYAG